MIITIEPTHTRLGVVLPWQLVQVHWRRVWHEHVCRLRVRVLIVMFRAVAMDEASVQGRWWLHGSCCSNHNCDR